MVLTLLFKKGRRRKALRFPFCPVNNISFHVLNEREEASEKGSRFMTAKQNPCQTFFEGKE